MVRVLTKIRYEYTTTKRGIKSTKLQLKATRFPFEKNYEKPETITNIHLASNLQASKITRTKERKEKRKER